MINIENDPDIENQKQKIGKIQNIIMNWGRKNMRKYSWRETEDPYKIMIAEVMLHRTKVEQVEKIYGDFIKKYPDFKSIAEAGPEKIKEELLPLGLYWRASLLYDMADEIIHKHNGLVPSDKNELLNLSGAGPYISSAVLGFGFNKPEPILDTNTVRIIGRIFGLKINDASRRNNQYFEIMKELADCSNPRILLFSMIDFAALICKPRNKPKCKECPIDELCNYYSRQVN